MSTPISRTATSLYMHVITPVQDADYNILQVLYEVFTDPTEQKAFYDLYRGALQQALFVDSRTGHGDFSK